MSLLAWSSLYSVGIKDIDEQHRQLIAIANRLNDALKAGQGKTALQQILNDLQAYTESHFAFEAHLMKKHRYPLSPQHLEEHRKLVATIADFSQKHAQGDVALSHEVMGFLRDWLSHHIMNSDKMLGKDLNQKGIH